MRSPTARALEPRWIPGALHVPIEAVGRNVAHLPRDREIILYCTCPSEASAARVARILVSHGFERVRPLHGGLDAWIDAGYDVETSESPGALIAQTAAAGGQAMSHADRLGTASPIEMKR